MKVEDAGIEGDFPMMSIRLFVILGVMILLLVGAMSKMVVQRMGMIEERERKKREQVRETRK